MTGSRVLDLGLQKSPRPQLDIHDVGVLEAVKEVLELDEGLPAVLHLPEVSRRDVSESRLIPQGLVHSPLVTS